MPDKRLTRKNWNTASWDPWELCGMDNHCNKNLTDCKDCPVIAIYKKLAKYEDLDGKGLIRHDKE